MRKATIAVLMLGLILLASGLALAKPVIYSLYSCSVALPDASGKVMITYNAAQNISHIAFTVSRLRPDTLYEFMTQINAEDTWGNTFTTNSRGYFKSRRRPRGAGDWPVILVWIYDCATHEIVLRANLKV